MNPPLLMNNKFPIPWTGCVFFPLKKNEWIPIHSKQYDIGEQMNFFLEHCLVNLLKEGLIDSIM